MNRRFCVWTFALGIGCAASLAIAQAAPAPAPATAGPTTNPSNIPGINVGIKSSNSLSDAERAAIRDGFISPLVQIVLNGDAPSQQKARERLIAEVGNGSTGGFTAQFFDAYASVLDAEVVAALKSQPTPSLRARLTLAIVSAKIAERTNSSQQLASVEAMLKDPAEAVVLWGMKTAKFVLPASLQVQVGKSKLMPMMVEVGSKYPGPVLDEAYQGLTLSPMDIKSRKAAAAPHAQITAVIPLVQDLANKRSQKWADGVPRDPVLDTQATSFLTFQYVWDDQTPAQQRITLTLMHDLLNSAQNALGNTPDKQPLIDLIMREVSGFSVLSTTINDATLISAVGVAKKIDIHMPVPQVQAACNALLRAVEALPQMQGAGAPAAPVTQNGPTSRATSGSSPPADLAVIK